MLPTLDYEHSLWQQGYRSIAGIDEVGRGCWAGPVVAGAAVVKSDFAWSNSMAVVRDSKTMSPSQRQQACQFIHDQSGISTAIGQASVVEINHNGIAAAAFLAMSRALEQLPMTEYCLIDGFQHPSITLPQQAIVKGDARCLSIAIASIVAKEFRDNLMRQLANQYPNYHLDQHKGYGTAQHQQAIKQYGLSDIHRTSFKLKFLL